MKTKKFRKKLELNKKTIADLGGMRMGDVRGGDAATSNICEFTECSCELTCRETCQSAAAMFGLCCVTIGEHTCHVDCTNYCSSPGMPC